MKLKAILTYIRDMIAWLILRLIGYIIYPIIVYPLANKIWKNHEKNILWFFLWLFLNDGKYDETFTIATPQIAPDWFLEKHGFDLSHKPNKFERWFYAVKWNVFRNPVDNFLNYVIGFNGTKIAKIGNTIFFWQVGDDELVTMRFYWEYTSKFYIFNKQLFIAVGSDEDRYKNHFKLI